MEPNSGPTRRSGDALIDSQPSQRPRASRSRTTDEADTCRICRGEGTDEEPLYYPCKCSGSIKFVHQDCLMEWLSHSQKKYCELCKTSFRFTKLYDPGMPQTLPWSVFARKALVHILGALLTWVRGMLVASIWLFWLPWSMRFVWWGLFWLADAGWDYDIDTIRGGLDLHAAIEQFSSRPLNRTNTFNETSNFNQEPSKLSSAVGSITGTMLDFPFFKRFLRAFITSYTPHQNSTKTLIAPEASARPISLSSVRHAQQQSLLSELSFFRELTPNTIINRFIVDVLEGQIITCLVVVAFILVFLIREWVVQQQPVINLLQEGRGEGRQAPAGQPAPNADDTRRLEATNRPQGLREPVDKPRPRLLMTHEWKWSNVQELLKTPIAYDTDEELLIEIYNRLDMIILLMQRRIKSETQTPQSLRDAPLSLDFDDATITSIQSTVASMVDREVTYTVNSVRELELFETFRYCLEQLRPKLAQGYDSRLKQAIDNLSAWVKSKKSWISDDERRNFVSGDLSRSRALNAALTAEANYPVPIELFRVQDDEISTSAIERRMYQIIGFYLSAQREPSFEEDGSGLDNRRRKFPPPPIEYVRETIHGILRRLFHGERLHPKTLQQSYDFHSWLQKLQSLIQEWQYAELSEITGRLVVGIETSAPRCAFMNLSSFQDQYPPNAENTWQTLRKEFESVPPAGTSRPSMPARPVSSIAFDVRRRLEEKRTTEASARDTRNSRTDSSDELSDHSTSSWQHVQSSPGNKSSENLARTEPDSASEDKSRHIDIRSESETHQDTQAKSMASEGAAVTLPGLDQTPSVLEHPSKKSLTENKDGDDEQTRLTPEISAESIINHNQEAESLLQIESTSPEERLASADNAIEAETEQSDNAEIVLRDDKSIGEVFQDWIFGDIVPPEQVNQAPEPEQDEHVVEDIAQEAPFVPVANADEEANVEDNAEINPAHEAAEADGDGDGEHGDAFVEEEIPDDAEELEGVMELLGMQGPLAGLFQNSIFCAVLVSSTVACAVWLPYLFGKMSILLLANPVQMVIRYPLHVFSSITNFCVDFLIFAGCSISWWFDRFTVLALTPFKVLFPSIKFVGFLQRTGQSAAKCADSAILRIANLFVISSNTTSSDSIGVTFSALAAIRTIRSQASRGMSVITSEFEPFRSHFTVLLSDGPDSQGITGLITIVSQIFLQLYNAFWYICSRKGLSEFRAFLNNTTALIPKADDREPWTSWERVVAVLVGYCFMAVLGMLYLRGVFPLATSRQGKKIEKIVSDILQQAGGVLKVIFIIGIEMLVFPLYCGMLLDIAMLPLFEGATVKSRLSATFRDLDTAMFFHWFIGTCYMFHFALFVSMCRKIMRTGVLYFIRDPDDPSFHPVRDVLERSVLSQLRKIGFSAVVYGGLVIVCMGSVIWSVGYLVPGVFPIKWMSSTLTLGFPADLMLYNMVTPLVMQLTKPTKVLHAGYEWWFRKCARGLRLSHFLFGDQFLDEHYSLFSSSIDREEVDGRFVRAPASDSVRLPKGAFVFVPVDRDNNRLDGEEESQDGPHGKNSDQYRQIFIPSWFRTRLSIFVFCMWAITAVIGLVVTVVPLLLGRLALSTAFSDGHHINDIYAFAFGLGMLGSVVYAVSELSVVLQYSQSLLGLNAETFEAIRTAAPTFAIRCAKCIYAYGTLGILVPSILALLIEFYLIMPLHTYFSLPNGINSTSTFTSSTNTTVVQQTSTSAGSLFPELKPLISFPTPANSSPLVDPHVIHFLQDWTLGMLYLRIILRYVLRRPRSRSARALHLIVAGGWYDPDVRIATRCFVAPLAAFAATALIVPAPLGWLAGASLRHSALLRSALGLSGGADGAVLADAALQTAAVRFAYPACAAVAFELYFGWISLEWTRLWRGRIRDEVYLIGERLHNFGERKPPEPPRRTDKGKARRVEVAFGVGDALDGDDVSAGVGIDNEEGSARGATGNGTGS